MKNGVDLVVATGKALEDIVAQIQAVSVNVNAIVEASGDQAMGLKEINTAVCDHGPGHAAECRHGGGIDRRQPLAAREADALFQLIAKFEIGGRSGVVRCAGRPEVSAAGEQTRGRGKRCPDRFRSGPCARRRSGRSGGFG